jgi:hypothetical protein
MADNDPDNIHQVPCAWYVRVYRRGPSGANVALDETRVELLQYLIDRISLLRKAPMVGLRNDGVFHVVLLDIDFTLCERE